MEKVKKIQCLITRGMVNSLTVGNRTPSGFRRISTEWVWYWASDPFSCHGSALNSLTFMKTLAQHKAPPSGPIEKGRERSLSGGGKDCGINSI